MLLSKSFKRAFIYIALCFLPVFLSGCFRPLHGPISSGASLADTLASIRIAPLTLKGDQEYLAYVIRNETISELNGHGSHITNIHRYNLVLSYSEQAHNAHIDQRTSRVDATVIHGTLTYTLKEGDKTLYTGSVASSVSFERDSQRFATLRALRNAYTKLGKTLAQQIRTDLSLYFATQR